MKNLSPLYFLLLVLLLSCSEEEKKNPPVINSVQPAKSAVGDFVEISGSFLGAVSRVSFRGGGVSVSTNIRSKSETRLQVQVPEIAIGKADIEVESPDGKSGSLSFEVLRPAIQISAISPSQGKPGVAVIISGLNLDLVEEVRFSDGNSSKADFAHSQNGLSVTVPMDAKTGSICLFHADGKTCSVVIFDVLADPVIISLSSEKGVEGNIIEIEGEHLINAKVYFGSTEAKVLENTPDMMKAVVPKFSEVSELELTVQTAGGVATRNFTVAPASEIKTAIPNGLIPGSALTLKGTGFYEIQSILLPGEKVVSKSDLIRNEGNDITFKVPSGVNSGEVKIISQYGEGKPQSLSLIIGGSGLNTDNIVTNFTLNTLTTTHQCRDYLFVLCRKSVNGFVFSHFVISRPDAEPGCHNGYSYEIIGSSRFHIIQSVYQSNMDYVLKLEQNEDGLYSGLAIMIRENEEFIGNRVGHDYIFYSMKDGSIERLCHANIGSEGTNNSYNPSYYGGVGVPSYDWHCDCEN